MKYSTYNQYLRVLLTCRILGKYGGVPAMGGGLIMGRLPRDLILKATASPAAVEIQYSKVWGICGIESGRRCDKV